MPGAAAFLGGLFVAFSDRIAPAGAFLAVRGGIWFVIVIFGALALGEVLVMAADR